MSALATKNTRFCAHVARLAKTYQVAPMVRFFCCGKLSKRLDVIDRQACADVLATVSAASVLLGDYNRPDCSPASPAIRLGATDPIGGILARTRFFPVQGLARKRAKISAMSVAKAPRLLLKANAAFDAGKSDRRDVVRVVRSKQNGRLGIFSRVSPDTVHAHHVFRRKACPRAKPLAGCLAGENQHRLPAGLTGFLNTVYFFHAGTIARFGGAGTTGLVADRLQRSATLIELNPAYAAIARDRIASEAGLFAGAAE